MSASVIYKLKVNVEEMGARIKLFSHVFRKNWTKKAEKNWFWKYTRKNKSFPF